MHGCSTLRVITNRNVTQPGYDLFPVYVARTVDSGPNNDVISNYGEGTAAAQGPYSPLARPLSNVWQELTDD